MRSCQASACKGSIVQGTASRSAGSAAVTCGVPARTRTFSVALTASNATAGGGTLVSGPATARFELTGNVGGSTTVLNVFAISVTLVGNVIPSFGVYEHQRPRARLLAPGDSGHERGWRPQRNLVPEFRGRALDHRPPSPVAGGPPIPVTIDGTMAGGPTGAPLIEINGLYAGTGAAGLSIEASGSTIRGLVINRFDGQAIRVTGLNCVIAGNYIGTDVPGMVAFGNGNGRLLDGADGIVV